MSEQTSLQTRKDIEAHIIAQAWKDEAYKKELFSNSKSIIEREFGLQLPAQVSVQVLEENPTALYFVLPMCPSKELTEEQLEAVAGGFPVVSDIFNAGKDLGDTIYDVLH
ncbi:MULTISPECIES: NHLP leader peptide family RiPP precursor [Cyanophyceae]|uniref:NHLP leader peptide family RiPP precursor n=1 Tax=Cyanophyceae TaxID=3028117 RepID=UPI0016825ADB|nr:NHLP leader peptide family RiPP precursor [Trichocoleus sp. FACHB-40]MBD2001714.1 NHLP leader peptide family natural product precursor [Trichocoleus sp. FACHB-40]